MPTNSQIIRQFLADFDFKQLFIEGLGWSNPTGSKPTQHTVGSDSYTLTPIAQLSGVSVFEVSGAGVPDQKGRDSLHKALEKTHFEHLLIFVDVQRTQSLWSWRKRDGKKRVRREHTFFKGQPGDLFLGKLDGIFVDLNDLRPDGTIPISEVTGKLAAAFDNERVTKKFYGQFSTLRIDFIDHIHGIDNPKDREWYASVLLNRLMFVYFLQKRKFIQSNPDYLDDKLKQSIKRGPDKFYSEFLQALFFEGFAKPVGQRSDEAKALIGELRYLNGGLFLRHEIEQRYPNIHIPDAAFESVLDLFGKYTWHLDDTPGGNDNEINPDVLGYIFEKYINQKAFGAYYTRPQITEYLCERTIYPVLLDKVEEYTGRRFESVGELLLRLDANLCRRMLDDILPKLSVLDPACGSGAFLVAALKTLLDIYGAVFARLELVSDPNLKQRHETIRRDHPSVPYYLQKQIIIHNLYGVDIMPEAVEIAKLRLFLALVSAVETVEKLEPLPSIDFNLMTGNSLVGLQTVEAERFVGKQKEMFQANAAAEYQTALAEKRRLINIYRDATSYAEDLQGLRDDINAARQKAQAALDPILLDDFQTLGVKYEQIGADGKTKAKRPLLVDDIAALTPFHWGYEFDEVFERGGFDVIIANPPWEIFKPIDREFARKHDKEIDRRNMSKDEVDKRLKALLDGSPQIRQEYVEYLSSYPHVSAYYRSSDQYKNQISVVNGKKAGSDINLYKLFTELCFRLARPSGLVGIVIPSGIYTDLGAKQLREMLFAESEITGLFSFENRKEIFEGVDSRFKFVVLTYRKGGQTNEFPAAFMRHEVEELYTFPNENSLKLTVETIRRLSPDSLSVPEFKGEIDAQIADKMAHFPLLGEEVEGAWQVRFGSEFHMTNDHDELFETEPAPLRLPLYEGKMIWHYTADYAQPRYWVDEKKGRASVLGKKTIDTQQKLNYEYYRLAYRSITGSTNERTMVCSIIPQKVFFGHSLNAVNRDASLLSDIEMLYLQSVMSSFIFDYSIRQRVATQLTMFFVYQTSVPRLKSGDKFFDELVSRAARLVCTTPEFDDLAMSVGLRGHQDGVTNAVERGKLRAEIDGIVARLYGLTEVEFAHILTTFPLVPEPVRLAARNAYRDVERGVVR